MTSSLTDRPQLAVPTTLAPSGELLVALDIDGTIVNYDGEMHPVIRKGVRATMRRGAHVVLATGRGIEGVVPIAEQLGMTSGYAVCANGAVVIDLNDSDRGYEVTDAVTFDPRAALDELRERVPGALFLVDDGSGQHYATAPFPAGELVRTPEIVPFEQLREMAASRVTVRAPDLSRQDLADIAAAAGLGGVGYYVGWSAWLDIAPQGISKASALEMLRGRLKVAPNATVAVGDGTNDLEMLSWAHYSVAMGQAPDVVKAHADAVTASIDDGGLAYVLSAILTRPRPLAQ